MIKLFSLQWEWPFYCQFSTCLYFMKNHWIQLNCHFKRGEHRDQKSYLRKNMVDDYDIVPEVRWGNVGYGSTVVTVMLAGPVGTDSSLITGIASEGLIVWTLRQVLRRGWQRESNLEKVLKIWYEKSIQVHVSHGSYFLRKLKLVLWCV